MNESGSLQATEQNLLVATSAAVLESERPQLVLLLCTAKYVDTSTPLVDVL